MNVRKLSSALVLAGVLSLPAAANAIQILGIDFPAGSVFETADLFESEDTTFNPVGNGNGAVELGEYLVGIGIVNRVLDPLSNVIWQNGDNGRELTILLKNYKADNAFTSFIGGTLFSDVIQFTGGEVEIWSQAAGTFTAAGTQAAGIASVNSGAGAGLFLGLVGSPLGGFAGGLPITLESTGLRNGGNPFETAFNLTGRGFLDVTSGAAMANFDTNTFLCGAGAGAPCPDDADKAFTSSAQLNTASVWASRGTGEIQDFAIPEPGSLALLGAGLIGFAFRRRNAA